MARRKKGELSAEQKQTPAPLVTPLEEACRTMQQQVAKHAAQLKESCYTPLSECTVESGVPEALAQQVEGELDSLHRTSMELLAVQAKTVQMEDELRARMNDVQKEVNRAWYRRNPPSNAAIDLKEERTGFFARGLNLYKLALVFFIGSFAGVVVELIWCLIRNGYLESRAGVVWGPFNPLYGIGAVALSVALYRYRNRGKWLSFLGGMVIGSLVEYVCSWGQELIFGSRSWDYSQLPFNINGRICLLYSVFWGILGVFWIKDIYPRMAKWILKLPNQAGKILTWVATVFLIVNCMVSLLAMWRWAERQQGLPAGNAVAVLMDQRFPNERMERIYANMTFGAQEENTSNEEMDSDAEDETAESGRGGVKRAD